MKRFLVEMLGNRLDVEGHRAMSHRLSDLGAMIRRDVLPRVPWLLVPYNVAQTARMVYTPPNYTLDYLRVGTSFIALSNCIAQLSQ